MKVHGFFTLAPLAKAAKVAAAAAAVMTLGTLVGGCATAQSTAPTLERSPAVLAQPLDQPVVGRCVARGDDAHEIRHDIKIPAGGRLQVVMAVDQPDLRAEVLVRSPSGQYVRQTFTDSGRDVYQVARMAVERGTWQVVVVCRQGMSQYTLNATLTRSVAAIP